MFAAGMPSRLLRRFFLTELEIFFTSSVGASKGVSRSVAKWGFTPFGRDCGFP